MTGSGGHCLHSLGASLGPRDQKVSWGQDLLPAVTQTTFPQQIGAAAYNIDIINNNSNGTLLQARHCAQLSISLLMLPSALGVGGNISTFTYR